MSDYPEHDKLHAISKQSQAVGEFLDWLGITKNIQRCSWMEAGKRWVPQEKGGRPFTLRQNSDGEWGYWEHYGGSYYVDTTSIQSLLAEFFEIDQDKLEEEKRAILDDLREQNRRVET